MTFSAQSPAPPGIPQPLRDYLRGGRMDVQRREAAAIGISDTQLARWRAQGVLEHLGGGSYLVCSSTPATHSFEEVRRYHLRRATAVLGGLPGAYVVGRSAAWSWGLPLLHPPADVELSRRPRLRTGRPGLDSRRAWGLGGHTDSRRQPMAEAIVEIAGREGAAAGLVVADAALHRGLDRDELEQAVARYGSRRGAACVRVVCDLARAEIESPGESQVHWIGSMYGIALRPQTEIYDEHGRFVARVDFLVEGTCVVVEFDGLGKYRTGDDLRAEKNRQLTLERLGYVVVRFTYRDLARPAWVAQQIRTAMTVAAGRG